MGLRSSSGPSHPVTLKKRIWEGKATLKWLWEGSALGDQWNMLKAGFLAEEERLRKTGQMGFVGELWAQLRRLYHQLFISS